MSGSNSAPGSGQLPVPPPPMHHHHGSHPPPPPPPPPHIGSMPIAGAIPPPIPSQPFGSKTESSASAPSPATQPTSNRAQFPNGSKKTSTSSNTTTATPQSEEGFDLASYVYNVGFIHTAWADTFLSISPHPPLRLHALFASRSPVLYRYLSSSSANPPYHINMSTDDKNITSMSLSMALATLYGHSLDINNCDLETAKGLLASGCLLGIDSVASFGIQVILASVSKENLEDLFRFATASDDFENISADSPGPYPPYTNSLVSILVDFVLSNFNASTRPIEPAFKSILLNMPFYLLKQVCESDKLIVKSHMERHAFAREILAARKEYKRANNLSSPYEETVVLAFGGGKGGVEVIRKLAGKKKTLWKAGA